MKITRAGVDVSSQYLLPELEGITIAQRAQDGEVGQGSVPIPASTGSDEPYAGQQLLLEVGLVTIMDGFVGGVDRDRAGVVDAAGRLVHYHVAADENALLTGYRTSKWKRPRETDRARILAYVEKFLGHLDLDTTWVLNTNTRVVKAKTYHTEALYAELQADCGRRTGKTMFIENRRFHWHRPTEGIAAGLTVVNAEDADGTTAFALESRQPPRRSKDPMDLRNDVVAMNEKGQTERYQDATSIARHDAYGVKHQGLIDGEDATPSELLDMAEQVVLANKDERITYEGTIGPLTAEQLELIPPGSLMTVSDRVWGLTESVQRIGERKVRYRHPNLFWVDLELSNPNRLSVGGPSTTPAPAPGGPAPYVPPTADPTIAAQATLAIGNDAGTSEDVTWLYPGGTPAGRLVQGRRYMLRLEVILNRQIQNLSAPDDYWWDRTWSGFTGHLTSAVNDPTPAIDITSWDDPTGIEDGNLDPGNTSTPGEIYPDGLLIGSGSSFVSRWYTWTDPDVDFDMVLSGSILSAPQGADTVARLTLYEQTADGAPVTSGGNDGPLTGQQVNKEPGAPGDGVITTGRTSFSYMAGSLRVHVNGIDWSASVNETNPATGDYTLDYAPKLDAEILRYYQRGNTGTTGAPDASGRAGSPAPEPGPITSPELPDIPVDDGDDADPGDLQALINAAAEGEVLELPKMRWHEAVTVDTFGLTINFNGGTIDAEGTRAMWLEVRAHDVEIQNLLCVDALPDAPAAQKLPQTGSLKNDGWEGMVLRNVHLRQGRDMGLLLQRAANATLVAFSSNQNPRSGASIGDCSGLRILDSQFNDNKTDATYDPQWEGGGYKIGATAPGRTNDVLIERTEASGNGGPGHWIDEHPSNVTFRDCLAHHNAYAGFMYEIATGGVIVRPRTYENGWGDPRGDDPAEWGWGAGILISSSGIVDVIDYISAWDAAGITRINQGDRSNRENTVRLTGSGGVVAADDDRRISSWHQDGSGNQILTTDPSNHESGLSWFCASGESFNWDGDMNAAAFAATRGGVGLTELDGTEIAAILSAADILGVAGVGIPTSPEAH